MREELLRFSREIAFAAARVYASAAENRGSWDERLEALVIDNLVSGDGGRRPAAQPAGRARLGRRRAGRGRGRRAPRPVSRTRCWPTCTLVRRLGLDAMVGVHADRLVVVVGGVDGPAGGGRPAGARLRGRAGGRRPGRERRLRRRGGGDPGGAERAARGAGLAGRAASGQRRRAAARARPGRRRAGPRAARRRRSTGRWSRPATCSSTRSPRSSTPAARSRRRPARCSSTPTPCATGCAGSPRSAARRRPTRAARFALRVALVLGRLDGHERRSLQPG